jgi:hypothetical protein
MLIIKKGDKVSPIAGPFKGRVGVIEFVGDGYARVRYEDKETTEYGVYAFEWLNLVKDEEQKEFRAVPGYGGPPV